MNSSFLISLCGNVRLMPRETSISTPFAVLEMRTPRWTPLSVVISTFGVNTRLSLTLTVCVLRFSTTGCFVASAYP